MFFNHNKEKEVVCVLSIGSSSVGGMLTQEDADGKIKIISSIRVPVSFLLDVNFESFKRYAENSIKKVFLQLSSSVGGPASGGKDYNGRIAKVFCVTASPWFVSQTRIVSVKRQETFIVTENFLDELINKEKKIFESNWQSQHKPVEGDSVFLETDNMKVYLNGYSVKNPFDKKVKSLELYSYMSLGLRATRDLVEKLVLKNFGHTPVFFRTLPFVTFSVLRDVMNVDAERGFVFIDIGGDVSDVSLVRKGVLEEVASISHGRNMAIREVARSLKISVKEAADLIKRVNVGHALDNDSKKVDAILTAVRGDWIKSLLDVFEKISADSPLPQDVFFISNAQIDPELIKELGGESFSKFTIFRRPLEVRQILPGGIKHYFKFLRSFDADGDLFLMIESLFANSLVK